MESEPEKFANASMTPEWQRYERLATRLIADQFSTSYCVTSNARVQGKFSERSRQIEVLIDERHTTENRQRIIVDAKARGRQIDVTRVEAFRGLMEDVEASHGYLVWRDDGSPNARAWAVARASSTENGWEASAMTREALSQVGMARGI